MERGSERRSTRSPAPHCPGDRAVCAGSLFIQAARFSSLKHAHRVRTEQLPLFTHFTLLLFVALYAPRASPLGRRACLFQESRTEPFTSHRALFTGSCCRGVRRLGALSPAPRGGLGPFVWSTEAGGRRVNDTDVNFQGCA